MEDKITKGFVIKREHYEKLRLYAFYNHVSMSKFLRDLLDEFLKEYEKYLKSKGIKTYKEE